MASSPEIENLKAMVKLSEVVGEHVELSAKGRDFVGCCPFHAERSPSFTVHDHDGYAKCFGCGWSGDHLKFLQESEGLDFKAALARLAAIAGVPVPERSGSPRPGGAPHTPKPAARPNDKKTRAPREKLTERWGPTPTREEFAASYGLTLDDFSEAGFTFGSELAFKGAPSQPAVVYPITMPGGLVPSAKKFKTLARLEGRTDSGELVSSKRQCRVRPPKLGGTGLIGASDLQDVSGLPLVLAGGEEKLLACRKAGFRCVSLQNGEGGLSEEIADWIADAAPAEVILPHDADTAGREAVAKGAALLRARGLCVRAVAWPDDSRKGYDVNDYLVEHGADALRRLLLEAPEPPTVEQTLDAKAATNGHHETPPEAEEWGPVLPLEDLRPDLPLFPMRVMPGWFRRWAEWKCAQVKAPIDIAGAMGLAVISTAIHSNHQMIVESGWSEHTCGWFLAIAEPSEGKSPVSISAMQPIFDRQDRRIEQHNNERSAAAEKCAIIKRNLTQADRQAAKGDAAASEEAKRLRAELAEAQSAAKRGASLLYLSDTTVEGITQTMAESGESIALLDDEGGMFDMVAPAPGQGRKNTSVLPKGYSGTPISQKRISRDTPPVRSPSLVIGIAAQQRVLTAMTGKDDFQGTGVLARFIYAIPQSRLGKREWDETPGGEGYEEDDDYQADWNAAVGQLFNAPNHGPKRRNILRFSPGALRKFYAFRREFEARLDPELGDLAPIGFWAGKQVGRVARLAAMLHCARHCASRFWEMPVETESLDAALAIHEWSIPHAFEAFRLLGAFQSTEVRDCLEVVSFLQSQPETKATRNQLYVRFRQQMEADQLSAAIEMLTEKGMVRTLLEANSGGSGKGRKRACVILNPTLKTLKLGDQLNVRADADDIRLIGSERA